jgi:hypothetical protein
MSAGGGPGADGLGQRVVVTLLPGPGIVRPHRRGQRLQHCGHHRGALGGQVAGDDTCPGERGLDTDLAVLTWSSPPVRAGRPIR